MAQVGVRKLKDRLSGYLKRVQGGEEIVVALHPCAFAGEQFEAVRLGAGQRLFVGEDLAFAKAFQADACHEPFTGMGLTFPGEDLMVDIQGIVAIAGQRAILLPAAEEANRTRIAVIRRGVTRFFPIVFHADDVTGMLLVQRVLKGRIDHVVRRSHQIRECPRSAQIVPKTTKRPNVGHGLASRNKVASEVPFILGKKIIILREAFPVANGDPNYER